MDNYQELISEATVIKNENAPRENTANRIGSAFINVINAMKGIDDDLDTYIATINSTFASLRSEIQDKLNAAAIQWANDIRNAILALTTKDIKENGRSQETINADVAAQFIRDAAQWKADIQTAINGLTTKDIRENGKTQEKINAEVSAKFIAAAAQWASDIKDAILALTTKDIKEGGRSQETINAEVAAQFVAAAAQWADDIDNGFTKRRIKGFTTKPDELNSASDMGIYYMNVNAGYNKLRGTGLLSVGINFSNVVYQTFLSTNIPVYDDDGNITSFNSKACILSRSYQNGAWTQWKEQIPELSTVNIRENGRTQEEINAELSAQVAALIAKAELNITVTPTVIEIGKNSNVKIDGTLRSNNGMNADSMNLYADNIETNPLASDTNVRTISYTDSYIMSAVGDKTFVVTASISGGTLSISTKIYGRYATYCGFGATYSAVVGKGKRLVTSAAGGATYTGTAEADGVKFYILVPTGTTVPTTFTMNATPFVMRNQGTQTISDVSYTVLESGSAFNIGGKVNIVAS